MSEGSFKTAKIVWEDGTLEKLVEIGIEAYEFTCMRCSEERIAGDALCSIAMQSGVVDFTEKCFNLYAAPDKTEGEIAEKIALTLDDIAANFTWEAARYRAIWEASKN